MPRRAFPPLPAVALAALAAAAPAHAADAADGAHLPLLWGVPFAGLLLSIALVPLASAKAWHDHYGKIAAAWAAALVVPFAATFGVAEAWHHVVHAVLREFIPFVTILFALYVIAGGICVHGHVAGTPLSNTLLLALGAVLASFMGTTGASMLLIRPLLAGNEGRRHRVHVVIFFILLVGNVGGALTPLGDPPLFIGFLKGVDFFWTTGALALPTVLLAGVLLVVFYVADAWCARHEPPGPVPEVARGRFWIEGARNLPLLAGIVGAVLLSGVWKPDYALAIAGVEVPLQAAVRDSLLVVLALVSIAITPRSVREHNAFHWAPIAEVAKLFVCIFVTIFPVLAILQAGRDGALGAVVRLLSDANGVPDDTMYFWATGLLSAFLDNAPTYLVFFNLAGGDAASLMGPLKTTLMAISMGAVYFGALTYIGNAPNFMIKAIAEDRGIAMPTFFGYFGRAAVLMLPLLAALGVFVL